MLYPLRGTWHELAQAHATVKSSNAGVTPAFLFDLTHEVIGRRLEAELIPGLAYHLGIIL